MYLPYHEFGVRCDGDLPHPIRVARDSPNTMSSGDFPQLDGLVAGRREQVIASRHEHHTRDIMIVAVKRPDAGVRGHVPEFDAHVRWTRRWEPEETFLSTYKNKDVVSRRNFKKNYPSDLPPDQKKYPARYPCDP